MVENSDFKWHKFCKYVMHIVSPASGDSLPLHVYRPFHIHPLTESPELPSDK